MSDRNHVTRRSRSRRNSGRLLVQALSLLVAGLAGYFLGVRLIGPSFIGHANAVGSSAGSAPASTAAVAAANRPDATTASGAANANPAGSPPVAIITDRRHHRADDASGADSTDAAILPRDHPVNHHRRRRPAHPHVDTNLDQTVGDQTVLPEDTAKVGGADNQPAGQDSTGADTPAVGDSTTPPPAAGDSNPPAAPNDSVSPDAGDTTTPPPAHRRRRRRRPSRPDTSSPTAPNTPSTGDTTPAPGDNSSAPGAGDQGAGDHGAGAHTIVGRWVSV